MAVKKVLLFGNKKLRKKTLPVKRAASKGAGLIYADLRDTLHHLQGIHGKGGGLAAPQIGYNRSVVYINAKKKSFFLVNPKIIKKSASMFDVWDFCFSSDALFLAKIKRHKKITVSYSNEKGEKTVEEFSDYWSELMQHEIDHLNGVLFIDHIKDPKNLMVMPEWDKLFTYRQ